MLPANDSTINAMDTQYTSNPIDWQLCLKLANNKADLAQEMLSIFINEVPVTIENISTSFASHDFKELHRHIHKLHGATCYCGLPRLKTIVADTETSLKSEQTHEIENQVNALLTELEQIKSEYKADTYK